MNMFDFHSTQRSAMRTVASNEAASVQLPRGSAVYAITGQVWVTQEGRLEDIVLSAGDRFDIEQKGLVVISATAGTAAVYLAVPTEPTAQRLLIEAPGLREAFHAKARRLRREEFSRMGHMIAALVTRLMEAAKTRLSARAKSVVLARKSICPPSAGVELRLPAQSMNPQNG